MLFFILAVLPLERIPSVEVGGSTVRLSQVAAVLLIGINLPTLFEQRAQLAQPPWRWIWLFLLVMGLSTLLAFDPGRAVLVTLFTVFVVLMAWTISLRLERDQLRNYASTIVVGALAACAFGFYQFFGDLLGLPSSLTGLLDRYTKSVFGFPRIQATSLEPLYFADYLLLPICLVAVLYLFGRSSYAWPLVPILVCFWLTLSRGAFAAIAVVLLLLILVGVGSGRTKRVAALLGVVLVTVGIAIGLIGLGAVIDDEPSESDKSIETFSNQSTNLEGGSRGLTRDLATRAFAQRPLLGIGPGNFGSYAHDAAPSVIPDNSSIVNNEPLEILAETGIIGLLCFSLFALSLLWLAIETLAKHGVREQPLTLGLLCCLIGYAVHYQTFSTLYITHVWVTIGLLVGYSSAKPVRDRAG